MACYCPHLPSLLQSEAKAVEYRAGHSRHFILWQSWPAEFCPEILTIDDLRQVPSATFAQVATDCPDGHVQEKLVFDNMFVILAVNWKC